MGKGGLMSRIYKEPLQLNNELKKWAKDVNSHFPTEDITKG